MELQRALDTTEINTQYAPTFLIHNIFQLQFIEEAYYFTEKTSPLLQEQVLLLF
jgi:hypothetical protein